jgi:tRNA(fMet)-specific endonuclease VapC
MLFLLDTDHITLYREENLPLQRRIGARAAEEFGVTIVSFEEQVKGWLSFIHRAQTPVKLVWGYRSLQETLRFFAKQQVLPFDETAALYFQQLQQQRLRVGTQDLRIAAIALANRCTVVTRNRRDFERVPGLLVEDWSVAATE